MKGLRQGRFNSNYKGGCPTVNILASWEWDELMKCEPEQIRPLLLKFNREYMSSTYPSKIDIEFMYNKVITARNGNP